MQMVCGASLPLSGNVTGGVKEHGVPQDVLKTNTGPLFQRF